MHSHIGSIAGSLGVSVENVRSSSAIAGKRVFAGEPVAYSMRKLWVRFSAALLDQKGGKLLGALSPHDSVIAPAVSPPLLATSPAQKDLEYPPFQQAVYAAVSDFGPDRTDGAGGRPLDHALAYDGFLGTASLRDLVVRRLEQALRGSSARGVSVDLRMVGAGETLDFLRFLARIRKIAGRSRKVIASVPGEWFCRRKLGRAVFRSALAGFAVEDMLEHVDVIVARCWRDPVLSGALEEPLTSLGFIRDVTATALKHVPCWRLAAGFMCGAVVQAAAQQQTDAEPEDHVDALAMDELTERFVVRRRYLADDDCVKAFLISRKIKGAFWFEDARTLPRRLDLVNRNNLVGVELFWPDQRGVPIEICRSRFLPLQDFEG